MSAGSKNPKVKETAAQKAQAEAGWNYWQDYMKRGKAVEAAYRERLKKLGSDTSKNRIRESGIADFEQSVGFGLDPNNAGAALGKELVRAGGRADIAGATEHVGREQFQRGQESVVSLGRGVRGIGDAALNQRAATSAVRESGRAEADLARAMAMNDMIGTAAGYGIYRWGAGGDDAADASTDISKTNTRKTY